MIKRQISPSLIADLDKKILILSGPRQCGKTTVSKGLFKKFDYFNFDEASNRLRILRKEWDREQDLLILDELHKMKNWKSFLKGIYDTEGVRPRILVTGSAKLAAFKKAGDSLAGRHFNFRLHPFDLKEIKNSGFKMDLKLALERLLTVGGFPEPFLEGSANYYNKWRRSHIDLILRQDSFDLEVVRDINSLETLIYLLSERIGSPVSTATLAQQLGKDPKTVQRWLLLLENLFIIFRLSPFHKNIARAIKKEPKYYFYDTGLVRGEQAQKFENVVACSLLKETHYLEDALGYNASLSYLRNKEGREIDFLIQIEGKKPWLIEVKWADSEISKNFKSFSSHFKNPHQIQLVFDLEREFSNPEKIEVCKAGRWLADYDLLKV